MIVAGIGCRRGADADAVVDTLVATLEKAGILREQLHALAVPEEKRAETGIRDAARRLALPVISVSPADLQAAGTGALSMSLRVQALKGVPSVAEAAALAAAGTGARLIAPRTTTPTVACALAIGDGP